MEEVGGVDLLLEFVVVVVVCHVSSAIIVADDSWSMIVDSVNSSKKWPQHRLYTSEWQNRKLIGFCGSYTTNTNSPFKQTVLKSGQQVSISSQLGIQLHKPIKCPRRSKTPLPSLWSLQRPTHDCVSKILSSKRFENCSLLVE